LPEFEQPASARLPNSALALRNERRSMVFMMILSIED
jgi:hypothetical protein